MFKESGHASTFRVREYGGFALIHKSVALSAKIFSTKIYRVVPTPGGWSIQFIVAFLSLSRELE